MIHEQVDYTVQLPVFEGPLDLLLRLIEREELDITTIALAQVADQYLAHVRALELPDPAPLSAFLTVAARLLLIKSRALLPRPALRIPGESVDEGEQLVQQLREYQRYKQAAALLRQWQDDGRRLYLRQAPPPVPSFERPQQLDVTLAEMIAAVQRRMQLLLPLEPPAVPLPTPKVITVPEMAAQIQRRLSDQSELDFVELLSAARRRVELIVAFWAVLELLKRRVIVVEQATLFGAILLRRGPVFDPARLYPLDAPEMHGP